MGGSKKKKSGAVGKWGEPSWSTSGSELTGLERLFMGATGWGKPAWSDAPPTAPAPRPNFVRRGRGPYVSAPAPSATAGWGQPHWSDIPPPAPAPRPNFGNQRQAFGNRGTPSTGTISGNRGTVGYSPPPINPIRNWGIPSWRAPRPFQSGGIVNAMPRNIIPGYFPGGTNHGYRR